jgi:6-pyruvoyl-tetrahydropterin synthase
MKYLKITNKGEIDWRLISLLGGTTKRENSAAIGRYGSGLKYVLAFLLRENLAFKIFSGIKEVVVSVDTESIRGEEFDIICIDGHRTSITTKMGPDFQTWHCVRELWSNAIDEGENSWSIGSEVSPVAGMTHWYIQLDKQIQEVIKDWDKYFIHHQKPLWGNEYYKIYPGGQSLRIYKSGVLVHEDTSKPALFAYDSMLAEINELREFKGSQSCAVVHALSESNEDVAKYFFENIKENMYEGDMDWNWFVGSWSEDWKNVLGDAKLIYPKAMDDIKSKGITLDEVKLIVVPQCVYKELTKFFPGIGALKAADKSSQFYENYDEKLEFRVKQCLAILETCEYVMHPELEFRYGFFEDKGTMARVNLDEKIVYISQTMLNKSLFDITAMLIEENEHFNTGLTDESRAFQQHWINLYTKELLTRHEVEV